MILYQREFCEEFIPEIESILPLHYKELALDQDDVVLDPNYDEYRVLEAAGFLHIFTARKDGELIGYILGTIKGHIHYNSTIHYVNDIYYLKQEHRNTGTGFRFFQAHEKELQRLGVKRIVTFTKCHQSHEKMFSAMGYKKQDIVMSKVL
jgi:hypothetical protein